MKQRTNIVTAMMMEMCMWTCRICKPCCVFLPMYSPYQEQTLVPPELWRNNNRLRPGDFVGVSRYIFCKAGNHLWKIILKSS